ncbi:DNA-binding protein [Mucilaginibacter pedocola]|uniref:Helix-turn-helix domain-containing protein n=1 Tax=Mucilaginibacter pedocola TaxID=1792845 RepID=A0A1S9PMK8_9SPHI|nr:DNA-binding protein [Mucilaginibacter pedocola]OOQ62185.1 hypothetical protein BC343_03840 [Mucilaginibacter pedocola]
MEVICLEEPAFYQLIEKVVARIQDEKYIKEELWLTGEQAMKKLGISSKTTLFKIRDSGQIRFVYASPRVILYETASINEYLSNNAKDTF